MKQLSLDSKAYRCQVNVFLKAYLFRGQEMFRSNLMIMSQDAQVTNHRIKLICQIIKMKRMNLFILTVFNLIASSVRTLVKKI